MTFPDLPHIPDLPDHRPGNMTVPAVLSQARAALVAATDWLYELENSTSPHRQFAALRLVVIEMRRSTFLLQKLSSRVEGWAEFWAPLQEAMREDPLVKYFSDLRTQVEKEGLPAALAELVERDSGRVFADVACGEDDFGVWVAGSARRESDGTPAVESGEVDRDSVVLRNFRLADPPRVHRGERLSDLRFAVLAGLAVRYLLEDVLQPVYQRFKPCR